MKMRIGAFLLCLVLAGCVTTRSSPERTNDSVLGAAMTEDLNDGKKLVVRFAPEVPAYDVVFKKETKQSEIRWKASAKESVDKEYVFSDRGPGIKRAVLTVDAAAGTGLLRVFCDTADGFSIYRQSSSELVLVSRGAEISRRAASLADPRRRRVNLNVKNAPLDKLLRTLASESSHSLVLGSAVAGNVTVTLQNMPYEQAIDMILRPTGYRAEHAGDVTVIRSAKDDKNFRAFKLRHVDAGLVLKTVTDVCSKDAQATVDPNTNTIFVVDRVEMLRNLDLMIAQIDQEPRQVEVEAAIAEVDRENDTSFGVNYQGLSHLGNQSQVSANISQARISPFDPGDVAPKGMFVNLSWQSISGVLGLLASTDKLNLLARPRVLALNDQEASVIIGSKLGYKTVTVTTTGTVEDVKFLVVGTQLKIKPHITETGDILMHIAPEISDGAIDPKTGLPSEKTTTTETKVLARDGQTIILGGLMRDRVERRVDKVPLLGDLPLLGFFFSGTTDTKIKSEIVIMLSPKIVTPQLLTNHAAEGQAAVQQFYDETGETPSGK